MASGMVLYIALGSPAALRAQIMLKEKDLQGYQENVISFSKMEHKSEDYVRLNPRSQVKDIIRVLRIKDQHSVNLITLALRLL